MNSIEAVAKAGRFSGLGMASVVGLVIAGYLALAGSAFVGFDQRPSAPELYADDSEQALPALVCDCRYDPSSTCAAN